MKRCIVWFAFVAFGASGTLSVAQSPQTLFGSGPAFTDIEFAYLAARQFTGVIELCKLEEARGTAPAIKALATRIRDHQEHVRPVLIQHADDAAKNPAIATIDARMQEAHRRVIARLEKARDAALDRAFVREMIVQHETMQHLLKRSRIIASDLKGTAAKIGAEQSQELEDLKRLLPK